MTGSHIDTVSDGGPLDGALGVLASLECAWALALLAGRLPRALEVVAFSDEEGRFLDCLGSRALTGQLTLREVRRARDPAGRPLIGALHLAP